ncbi:hypothetical protein HRH25_23535 [Flavisolibacter sp. BT320]|nr:hypothetical protein [Flavisolibacter longurius]
MKYIIILLMLALAHCKLKAQRIAYIDSLKAALSRAPEDTAKVYLFYNISWSNVYSYPDTALHYANAGVELATKLDFKRGRIMNLFAVGEAYAMKGNYVKSLEIKLRALRESEALGDAWYISGSNSMLGGTYSYAGDYQKALYYFKKAKEDSAYFKGVKKYILGQIGECYLNSNQLDSAEYYLMQAYELDIKDQDHWTVPYFSLAILSEKKGNYERALDLYRMGKSIIGAEQYAIPIGYSGMAAVFNKMGMQDSAIYYSSIAVNELNRSFYPEVVNAARTLVSIFNSKGAFDSAFKYQEIMLTAQDSLFSQEKTRQIQNLSFNEQLHQQEVLAQQKQYRNTVRLYALLGIGVILLVVALILWRNFQHKQKAFALLQKQKKETEQQKAKAEQAYEELKATQAQLIQSEKMASLGELTAGIAHEIQNPLNFVNNFSELSKELVTELEEALRANQKEDAFILATDVQNNLEKIAFHGRRADSIVKGMLLHSRSGSAIEEMVDINSLVDEYLRLSYHGLRAKDKSFTAAFTTDFDDTIGKIEVVPQEIGRVLLNLYNNAFYAVTEKKKQVGDSFDPLVAVSTKKDGNRVKITVRDNGTGIPPNALDKIFQPFFTTKPTGQGTGLGLSLSYDIITKGHSGDMEVDSEEGKYTQFTIRLPVRSAKTEPITQP